MEERLQKILSRAGVASRRGSEVVIQQGRVSVNGTVVRELGSKADIEKDDVRVDGVRLKPPQTPVYLVLNKPKGVVTTRHDPEGRQTVMDIVPRVAGLFPVGRLDVTTEGLILLTNDGAFAERVSHPRYEVPRVYQAKVRGVPDARALERMRHGVNIEGDRMAVDAVRIVEADNNSWVEVTLHEGKHHEVKRLLEAVGHPVSKLRRVALGPLSLRGLEPGAFRELTPREVKLLMAGVKGPSDARPRPAPVRGSRGRRAAGRRTAAAHRPPLERPAQPASPRPPSSRPPSSRPRRPFRPAGTSKGRR